ncbi:MAG: flagellar protein FliO/FliZ [Gammaproteobacteria bacterium]|jgi:flagellar protein FliO/FliZ
MVIVAGCNCATAAPTFGEGSSSHPLMAPGYAAEYLLGVVLVMIALGVFAFFARRLQGHVGGGQDGLRVRASLALGGKERLVLVQVHDETLVLGVSPGRVQLVSKIDGAPPAPAPSASRNSWLWRTLSKHADDRAFQHGSGSTRK